MIKMQQRLYKSKNMRAVNAMFLYKGQLDKTKIGRSNHEVSEIDYNETTGSVFFPNATKQMFFFFLI